MNLFPILVVVCLLTSHASGRHRHLKTSRKIAGRSSRPSFTAMVRGDLSGRSATSDEDTYFKRESPRSKWKCGRTTMTYGGIYMSKIFLDADTALSVTYPNEDDGVSLYKEKKEFAPYFYFEVLQVRTDSISPSACSMMDVLAWYDLRIPPLPGLKTATCQLHFRSYNDKTLVINSTCEQVNRWNPIHLAAERGWNHKIVTKPDQYSGFPLPAIDDEFGGIHMEKLGRMSTTYMHFHHVGEVCNHPFLTQG